MKISALVLPSTTTTTFNFSTRQPEPDNPTRRRRGIGEVEKKSSRKRSGPATPFLRWKFEEKEYQRRKGKGKGKDVDEEKKKTRRRRNGGVSARKLGAVIWRLQYSSEISSGRGGGGDDGKDVLKVGVGEGCERWSCLHGKKEPGVEVKDSNDSPCSVNGPSNGYHSKFKVEASAQCFNYAMEGATKWNPVSAKESYGNSCNLHVPGSKQNPASVVASLQSELDKARECIEELETERKSSKKKMEHFLRKVSEERAAWRTREHEKVREYIDDMKADLNREKKSRQRLEIVNSKLVNDLAEAKLSAKRYMKEYEKERKARVLIEEVCDELAKEIREDKAEAEALKRENMKLREEVEDERKMLQMAEVWREERVQMKLVDAKLTLDEKYSQMNRIVAELENFLGSRRVAINNSNVIREVQMLRKAAASVNVQDVKELTYKPSKPDDIFSIFEEMAIGDQKEREIEQCVAYKTYSEVSKTLENATLGSTISYTGRNTVLDDNRSGWETVSQVEDQGGSCYSPDGSIPSVNRTQQDSNVSGSCMDWEINPCDITPITEITEVCSPRIEKQSNKKSSISVLWKPGFATGDDCKIVTIEEGVNSKLSNGRFSTDGVGIVSPDDGSGKVRFSFSDADGPWTSPELNHHHHHHHHHRVGLGKKGGCIEWPVGMQKSSLKQKLLEARLESQKLQLRQVLKQKI